MPEPKDDFPADTAGNWMAVEGPTHDVVVSSRIRLARNILGFNFKARLVESDGRRLEEQLRDKLLSLRLSEDQRYLSLENAPDLDRELLLERHLISLEMARGSGPRGVLYGRSQSLSVMVNEEDHLRLQLLGAGFELQLILHALLSVDEAVSTQVEYAKDPHFGFLTSCPTNVGTGLRISVMMHLPALVYSKEIEKVFNSAAKMKLAVRGFYGEGTSYVGDYFQVSNQVTLGRTEEELRIELEKVVPRIVEHEREVRRIILKDHSKGLEDKIYRAYGVLRYARRISSQEALDLLSQVRLGVCLGVLEGVDFRTLNQLLVLTQPAHIQILEKQELAEDERDVARARFIRERLAR